MLQSVCPGAIYKVQTQHNLSAPAYSSMRHNLGDRREYDWAGIGLQFSADASQIGGSGRLSLRPSENLTRKQTLYIIKIIIIHFMQN